MSGSRNSFIPKMILVLGSFLLALFILEMTCRFLFPKTFAALNERDFFCQYDSLMGWVNKPNTEGRFIREEFDTDVRINSKGLRDEEYAYQKQPATKRMVVLGDSFVWGYGVEEGERFTEILEEKLKWEVINMGTSGYGQDQELLLLRKEGIRYQPDFVLIAVHPLTDFISNTSAFAHDYHKPLMVLENGSVHPINIPVPQDTKGMRLHRSLSHQLVLWNLLIHRKFRDKELKEYFISFIDRRPYASIIKVLRSKIEPVEMTCALCRAIQKVASEEKATSLFVLIPAISKGSRIIKKTDKLEALKECLTQNRIAFLDLEPYFAKFLAENPETYLTFQNDLHWNAQGHRVAANAILQYLSSGDLLEVG